MLVVPQRTTTERQRVAFEAAQQELPTGESPHIVGAKDDAREIPDRVGDASVEREDVSLGGPAGMPPPKMSEDSGHRDSVTDGGSDPSIDFSEHGGGRLLARHGVKTIASLNIVGLEPPAFEAGQDAGVRRVVSVSYFSFARGCASS